MWATCHRNNEYEQLKRLRFVAVAIGFAWLGIAVMVTSIVIGIARPQIRIEPIFLIGLILMLGGGPVGVIAGATVRCPSCRMRVLQEPSGQVHTRVARIPMLSYWATAILRVLRGQQLLCAHCGSVIAAGRPTAPPREERADVNERLTRHRVALRSGNAMYMVGFALALALYQWGGFAAGDWAPIGIGIGFALLSIGPAVAIASWFLGHDTRDAVGAYAISQNMPMAVFYLLSIVGVVIFVFCVVTAVR